MQEELETTVKAVTSPSLHPVWTTLQGASVSPRLLCSQSGWGVTPRSRNTVRPMTPSQKAFAQTQAKVFKGLNKQNESNVFTYEGSRSLENPPTPNH